MDACYPVWQTEGYREGCQESGRPMVVFTANGPLLGRSGKNEQAQPVAASVFRSMPLLAIWGRLRYVRFWLKADITLTAV